MAGESEAREGRRRHRGARTPVVGQRRPPHRVPRPEGRRAGPPAPGGAGGRRRVQDLQEHAGPAGRARPRAWTTWSPCSSAPRPSPSSRRRGRRGQVAPGLRPHQPQPGRSRAACSAPACCRRRTRQALADVAPREVHAGPAGRCPRRPAQQMAGLLQALPRNFAYGLAALIDKQGGAPAPTTDEAPPEAATDDGLR